MQKLYNVSFEVIEAERGYFSGFDVAASSEDEAIKLAKEKVRIKPENLIAMECELKENENSFGVATIIHEYGKSYFELD